jgi:hypothetical protein
MTNHYKLMLAAFVLLLSAWMPIDSNAQAVPNFVRARTPNETPAPKVVFIGDQFTYLWATTPSAFPSNWINKGWSGYVIGENCFEICGGGTSESTAQRFQTDVIDLHPNIVHIMVASDDADANDDASVPFIYPDFLSSLQTMIKMAKAANIQVIFGTEGTSWSDEGGAHMAPLNSLVATLAAQNDIPVINYGDALCSCVGSTGGSGVGQNFATGAQYMATTPAGAFAPTPAGYELMTQMAGAVINTLNLKLTGGYLQNVQQANAQTDSPQIVNSNSGGPEAVYQFTPYGAFAGLATAQPFLNANFAGSTGTWASSNPLVVYVSQTGLAWALSAGTANVTYTSPTGVKFSEWTMTITVP